MAIKHDNIYWSIIIPCYNEKARINNIDKIVAYLRTVENSSELIVVNDGSTDDTLSILKTLENKYNFKLITYKDNRGKGYAIKMGMLAATGKHRVFMDVDLSTPIDELVAFEKFIEKYDVVIGTRKTKGAKVIVHQPWLRENMGKVFTFLSQIVLSVWVSDFTCGFKCFSDKAAKEIFQKTKIYRWGFDSEVLFLAKKYGFSIKEVPVTWKDDKGTKVHFPKDIINSLNELISIRYFDWIKKAY